MSIVTQTALGARALEPGLGEFRVWAPLAGSVEVRVGAGIHALTEEEGGFWAGEVAASAGDDYRFVLARTLELCRSAATLRVDFATETVELT